MLGIFRVLSTGLVASVLFHARRPLPPPLGVKLAAMRFLFTFVFTYEDDSSRLKHQNSSLGNLFVYPPRS